MKLQNINRLQKIILLCLAAVFTLSTAVMAEDITLTDYVGTGEAGYKDGGRLNATFSLPYGLTFDREGNLIVVDCYNNRIRKVQGDEVTTIAGTSTQNDDYGFPQGGYADGEALKARFNHPRDAVVDSKGNIFISDTQNHAIRKLSGGKIYTVAGTGKAGYKDGVGREAQFDTPSGLAIDQNDNIYVADSLNHVIRRIAPTGEVSTYAGKATIDGGFKDGLLADALFNEPSDMDFDKNGSLYILDSGNQLVRKIQEGKVVVTLYGIKGEPIPDTNYAKGGFADGKDRKAKFNFPKGIDIAENGTLFIADTWNHSIRAIKPDGTVITIAGIGEAGKNDAPLSQSLLNGPVSVQYREGKLYISDMWNNVIRVIPIDLNSLPQISIPDESPTTIPFDPPSEQIQIWIDGEKAVFNDAQPFTSKGSVFVPLRALCEQWGAQVYWNNSAKKIEVIKGDIYKTYAINGTTLLAQKGYTMIQLRTIAEDLGFKVEWVPEYRAVVIRTK